MALSANANVDRYVDQDIRSYAVAASKHVYRGSIVGLDSSGYAQPLVAGNKCIGIAYEEADNSSGSNGDISVRVFTRGDFDMALAGAGVGDIGRSVYASDDATLTFTSSANSFVGYVVDSPSSGRVALRLSVIGPIGHTALNHHAANFTLTAGQSGTVHTNLGAGGAIVATLPQSPPQGTEYRFVCMADQELRLEPGAAGGIYIAGAKQTDDLYVSVTDIGDFIHLIADGNGDWVAVASISAAAAGEPTSVPRPMPATATPRAVARLASNQLPTTATIGT